MKKLYFLSAIALLVFATCGCDEKDETTTQNIIGTWKCTGFGNTETNEVRPIEPADCDKCYVLTFKKDGTLEGYTSANVIAGDYVINNYNVIIKFIIGTEINEHLDGNKYSDALNAVTRFEIVSKQLKLHYNNTNYLLFKMQ